MHTDVFSLHLADGPDTLQRVLALCHRKQCDVVGVSFRAGDRHRRGRLELSVQAGMRAAELASRLGGMVEVLGVSSSGREVRGVESGEPAGARRAA